MEGRDPVADADELAGYVAEGYNAVKLKTGALSTEEEARRVRLTREAIGSEPLLMLDLNAPYGIEECIEFAEAVEPHDVYWLEGPLYWYLQPADFTDSPMKSRFRSTTESGNGTALRSGTSSIRRRSGS